MSMEYYLITNAGTLLHNEYAQAYPSHLVLAQMLLDNSLFAAKISAMIEGGTKVILDNGAHEGVVVQLNTYGRLAKNLKPWCVVLPDVVGMPAKKNRDRCLTFAERLLNSSEFAGSDVQLMYAVQGTTAAESLDAYDWAADNLDPDRYIIGIGQSYLLWLQDMPDVKGHEQARTIEVTDIMMNENAGKFWYHVLGARWESTAAYSKYPNIIGIDTIKPCHCALNHTVYPHKPPNTDPAYKSTKVATSDLLHINIMYFCQEYGASSGTAFTTP